MLRAGQREHPGAPSEGASERLGFRRRDEAGATLVSELDEAGERIQPERRRRILRGDRERRDENERPGNKDGKCEDPRNWAGDCRSQCPPWVARSLERA